MKNTAKALKNSIFSVLGQTLNLLLRFVSRRIFIVFLDIEYLGYHSLFANIFNLLSLTELGIANIISFHLFKCIVENNKEEIGKLMFIYKWVYRIIAIVIALLGTIAWFFLPQLVTKATLGVEYINTIYFLQLTSIILGYLVSYKRNLLIADQKEYKCIKYDLITSIVMQSLALVSLALTQNYIIYLILQLSTSLISNAIIARKTDSEYPYINETYNVTLKDVEKYNFISDIKNYILHRICYIVYGSTDNIIISKFCGIRNVALYSNYYTLQTGVLNILFYRLLNPIQSTIGNIVYSSRPKEVLWKQFKTLDFACWYLATYTSLGFLIFFQPTIELWMGKEYLLPYSFVIAYVITIYFGAIWEIVYKYRSVFGDFKQDRNCMILSAILNLVISIMLAKYLGITGVQIGTFFGFLPIAYGRIRFVVQNFFNKSIFKYLLKHTILMAIFAIDVAIAWRLTFYLPNTIGNYFVRGCVWAITPIAINSLFCFKTEDFKNVCNYANDVCKIIRNKINI